MQDGSPVMNLQRTRVLVLDEADRMCDMGFEDDIKTVSGRWERSCGRGFWKPTKS